MKCPNCSTNQKQSAGMTCGSCGYVFALNPKERPYLSDMAVKAVIDKLSGAGRYYFTYNQLYSALCVAARKRGKSKRSGAIAVCVVLSIIGYFVTSVIEAEWLMFVLVPALAVGLIWYLRRPVSVPHEPTSEAIRAYRAKHPIENLVDGNHFRGEWPKEDLKKELFDYAPERILIVQTDEMADMLILNRFHFENKTVVVSANKYPEHVFHAVQRFLERHPDIPVAIAHDASQEGLQLSEKLQADKSWNLEGKEIVDLGLSPSDVARMKNPLWIPTGRPSSVLAGRRTSSDTPEDKINQGMKVPVDFVAPAAMMGVLGMAVVGMMALMSTDLLAEQAKQATTGTTMGGGYG